MEDCFLRFFGSVSAAVAKQKTVLIINIMIIKWYSFRRDTIRHISPYILGIKMKLWSHSCIIQIYKMYRTLETLI